MSGTVLVWVAVFAALAMVALAKHMFVWVRVGALFTLVLSLWFVWGWYGVEYFADQRWPEKVIEPPGASAKTPAPAAAGAASAPDTTKTEPKDGPTARLGQVGDLFGGINALFAAFAFAGVAIAARLQAKSTEIAFKQAIEATFFSALELHHRIADGLQFDAAKMYPSRRAELDEARRLAGMSVIVPNLSVSGRAVFDSVLRWLAKDGNGKVDYLATTSNYRHLQSEHNYVLGHYFRNLYQLLKLIDDDEALDGPGKQKYASILRAQLSSDELALLMVNCVGEMVDEGQFRRLLVRYRMLEHLPLAKESNEYVRAGSGYRVVLADEASIGQYLVEPQVSSSTKVYRGAFGTNPALRPQS